jgi:hypothetical protein
MTIRREEYLYWLPPFCWVEQNDVLLVLLRPDGSVIHTFEEQSTVAEIVERYACEESIKPGSRLERTCERFLELPVWIVPGMLWFLGIIPVGLCAAALYSLWSML